MEKKVHILIIDDDEVMRRLFGGLLGRAGYEVIYAKNGDEGRETARRLLPDLILLDINMPGPDGYKTASSIKNEANSPAANIPIVFLTNEDLPLETLDWMKEFGVIDYIHKGVSNEEFIDRVKKVLSITQDTREKGK
jgi:two-component system alkaline phosphatase synthesis response regulator PhoP